MSAWRPIETAPKSGLILLAVAADDERRVYAAEWSHEMPSGHWVMTSGWIGWTRLHPSWQPTHWMPLPQPPEA